MKTEHPHAAILRAIADGETDFEVELKHGFEKCPVGNVLTFIKNMSVPPEQIRIKPKTRMINGIEVPEPYFGPMEVGQIYYIPYVIEPDNTPLKLEWENDATDERYKQSGYVHLSEENAATWSKAWQKTCAPETVIDIKAVQEPELKVGQKWLTVGGNEVRVEAHHHHAEYPFVVKQKDGRVYSVNPLGKVLDPTRQSDGDLEKLISDLSEGGGV